MFPYKVGIEWECAYQGSRKPIELLRNLQNKGYIIEFHIDINETSVQFPAGLKGLQGLQKVSEILKKYYYFNNRSGIHIHVDFSNEYQQYQLFQHHLLSLYIRGNEKWIIKSLEKWGYKGNFNKIKGVSELKNGWLRFPTHHKTLEFRIFEMSFFYEDLVKYVQNVQNIAICLKKELNQRRKPKK